MWLMVRHIDEQTHYDGKAHAMQSVVRVMMPTKEQRGLERPKLAQRQPTSHVTRTPLSRLRLKVKVTRPLYSPPFWRVRQLSGGRVNVLAVRNCSYVSVCSAARGASAPTGEEGRGHIMVATRLQLVYINGAMGRIVFGANHLWSETSMGRNAHGVKWPSMERNVCGAKGPDTLVYTMAESS